MEGAGTSSTAYTGIGQAFKKIYTEEAGPFTHPWVFAHTVPVHTPRILLPGLTRRPLASKPHSA